MFILYAFSRSFERRVNNVKTENRERKQFPDLVGKVRFLDEEEKNIGDYLYDVVVVINKCLLFFVKVFLLKSRVSGSKVGRERTDKT